MRILLPPFVTLKAAPKAASIYFGGYSGAAKTHNFDTECFIDII